MMHQILLTEAEYKDLVEAQANQASNFNIRESNRTMAKRIDELVRDQADMVGTIRSLTQWNEELWQLLQRVLDATRPIKKALDKGERVSTTWDLSWLKELIDKIEREMSKYEPTRVKKEEALGSQFVRGRKTGKGQGCQDGYVHYGRLADLHIPGLQEALGNAE